MLASRGRDWQSSSRDGTFKTRTRSPRSRRRLVALGFDQATCDPPAARMFARYPLRDGAAARRDAGSLRVRPARRLPPPAAARPPTARAAGRQGHSGPAGNSSAMSLASRPAVGDDDPVDRLRAAALFVAGIAAGILLVAHLSADPAPGHAVAAHRHTAARVVELASVQRAPSMQMRHGSTCRVRRHAPGAGA